MTAANAAVSITTPRSIQARRPRLAARRAERQRPTTCEVKTTRRASAPASRSEMGTLLVSAVSRRCSEMYTEVEYARSTHAGDVGTTKAINAAAIRTSLVIRGPRR